MHRVSQSPRVYKHILGDDTRQYREIVQKSNNLAWIASSAKVSKKHQAQVTYKMMYQPTITYCLPACSFSLVQLEVVKFKALFNFLPAMGFMIPTALALVRGPIKLGGYNISHLYAIHGAQNYFVLSTTLKRKIDSVNTLINNINILLLTSGRIIQVFLDTDPISRNTDSWHLHLKQFMNTYSLTF